MRANKENMCKIMKKHIHAILQGINFIFLHHIVSSIPCWTIRKAVFKAYGMKIGPGSRIGIKTIISKPQNIVIGRNSLINPYCHIDGRGGLTIKDNVAISNYAKIFTASHSLSSTTFQYIENPVTIENNVWIGSAAIILDRSHVGENAVIGAGAVFKGIAEPNMVYIGNPAKPIKHRNMNEALVRKHMAHLI